jgi:hypothetical protein
MNNINDEYNHFKCKYYSILFNVKCYQPNQNEHGDLHPGLITIEKKMYKIC